MSGPTHGVLTLLADGSFSYTPAAGFVGTDVFLYRIDSQGPNSNVATVSIVVPRRWETNGG